MIRLIAPLLILFSSLGVHAQTFLGSYTGHSRNGKSLTVSAGASAVRFSFYRSDILRVDFLPSRETAFDSSFVVIRDTTDNVVVTILDSTSSLTISSSDIRVRCNKSPLRLMYTDAAGKLLLTEPSKGGFWADSGKREATFSLNPREHFYGTGERGSSLDRRGLAFDSFNTQIGGYSSPLSTMNINIPFLVSTNGYALYFENTYKGRFDIGASDPATFSYMADGGELSYYLIVAPTVAAEIEKYTWLTGRQPLPPRWAFGYIQSKNRYQNETEARSIVQTMRSKGFPCDALVLDLKWFDNMGDLRWNNAAWPQHEKMVSDFRSQGIKTVLITEPYIVQRSVNYNEAATNGFFTRDSAGRTYVLDKWWSCGGCSASLLDMTNPNAQEWWWSKHPAFLGAQVAGVWTDLGEPERHPDDMRQYLGSTAKVHNIYSLLWAKLVFEGMAKLRPEERIFNLTRSGYAGIQRYGVIPWSGDVARSFSGLAVQLPMLLNMGLSGLAYHNSDIGGYSRTPTTPELYVRWMEYGVFCPITRAHGAGEVVHGSPTEPWQFGPDAERVCRSYLRLRYQLLPYIYTIARENYDRGMPLARPLFLMYPADSTLYDESSSYFFGNSLLISPVVEPGQVSKEVHFPRGIWYNYWTDARVVGGGVVKVPAPLDRIPLFVKAGSIIPLASPMNYSDERPLDTLMLMVYPGENCSFSLYEDDGKTLAYQTGMFARTEFMLTLRDKGERPILELKIGPSRGAFAGKLRARTYICDIHCVSRGPRRVEINGHALPAVGSYIAMRDREAGYYYDSGRSELLIQSRCNTDSLYALTAVGAGVE